MTILDTLITDRTEDDVATSIELCQKGLPNMTDNEKKSFLGGLKGGYGPSDMNRVREAIDYIDSLMVNAKRESVVDPVMISHAEYNGTAWRRWSSVETVNSDYVGPDIYLPNINLLWEAARRFVASATPRYDPNGNGFIPPDTAVKASEIFTIFDSVGLFELRVVCTGSTDITASGAAWTVEQTEGGFTARMDYSNCPYPDLTSALDALSIVCPYDGITYGSFTLEATLRYNYDVTAGTSMIAWSPFVTWGEATGKYGTWGGAKPRTWGQAARGENTW